MNVLLLGSTGSIGTTALSCLQRYPDRFKLVGLSARRSVAALAEQVRRFGVTHVCVTDPEAAREARGVLPPGTTVLSGEPGMTELVESLEFDVLLNALVGAVGLKPTVAALRRDKRVALANKESLVIGGDYISTILDAGQGELIPVDSEHSAILQSIAGEHPGDIESIILTASGGPFRDLPIERFASVTPADALSHPTWSMGSKITIDSATLINKGFEVIEAHHLFRLPYDRVQICIHPQSVVHSMVQFHDGAVIAQMGLPSMELPIQYALSYPHRLALQGKRLDLAEIGSLSFFRPDFERFPCLKLCLEAGAVGGTATAVVNAANEVAVDLFLRGKIPFTRISSAIEEALASHTPVVADSLDTIMEADAWCRGLVGDKLVSSEGRA